MGRVLHKGIPSHSFLVVERSAYAGRAEAPDPLDGAGKLWRVLYACPGWAGNYLKDGENVAEITLYSGNRNLLGPHHNAQAEEPTHVSPRVFELPGSWENGQSRLERKSYSFVRFGLHTPPQMTNGQIG